MKLSEVSIRRPVLAIVMSLAIILLGLISYGRLSVREYPDVDPPIVSVTTLYRGASPTVVETEITDILEEQFATLEDVKVMTSSSQEQGSTITIEFEISRDVDEAANDVRDRVSRIRGSLPREAEDPVIAKVDVDAQPIIWIALSSDRHTTLELSDLAERTLKDQFQRLPGIGNVFIGGERRYAMRVWLDPLRMAARGLTTQDIETAIRSANAEIPGGRVEGMEREFSVRTMGELQEPAEFASIIVRRDGENAIRLSDVATVEVGAEDDRTVTRFNGPGGAGRDPSSESRPPRGHGAGDRLRLGDLHRGVDPGGPQHLRHRAVAGHPHRAPVPQELPGHVDSDRRDSGRGGGHVHGRLCARILDQHHHPARAGSGHRARGR
jgi:multidrug efflux pump